MQHSKRLLLLSTIFLLTLSGCTFPQFADREERADNYYGDCLLEYELDNYQLALKSCNKSIRIISDDQYSYALRCLVKKELGDYSGAMQDCEKSIALDPEEPVGYRGLAKIKQAMGDEVGAEEIFKKIVALYDDMILADEDNIVLYIERGHIKEQFNDIEGAEEDYQKGYEKDPEDFWDDFVGVKEEFKDYTGAIRGYNELIAIYPDDVDYINRRGEMKELLGDFDEALEDYNTAIRLDPENVYVYLNRGILYIKVQQKELGCADLEYAASIDKNYVKLYKNTCK